MHGKRKQFHNPFLLKEKPEELQKFASILPDNNDNDVPDRVIEFVRKAINDS